MRIIGHIKTDFKSKFAVPKQGGHADEVVGKIIFEPDFRVYRALRGLDLFSHIWLVWKFSEGAQIRHGKHKHKYKWKATVKPPILGGNRRIGVFATRSPFRQNPIGIGVVKVLKISLYTTDGPVIYIQGPDLVDNTPIYDIKPYLPAVDSVEGAYGSYDEFGEEKELEVNMPPSCAAKLPRKMCDSLIKILSYDPRPAYEKENDKVFYLTYGEYEVSYKVDETTVHVIDIEE